MSASGKCLQYAKTRCKHLAAYVKAANATLSQPMIAKIDTPEARKIYGQRLAIGDPVFGNIRTQKRLDRLTLRGKIKVNIQWRRNCRVHNTEKIVHSRPSAHNTYVCGDKGRGDQRPDNQHCLAGKPRTASSPTPAPAMAAPYTQDWEMHRQHSQPYVGREGR